MAKTKSGHISELQILFGNNLKRIRTTAGVSQMQLGGVAGLTHNFINDLEHGNRGASMGTIEKLAGALNILPYEFFLPAEGLAVYSAETGGEQYEDYPEQDPAVFDTLVKAFEDFKNKYRG